MRDFEKLINASDLIEWIMETYPDWCEGAVRGIVDHVDEMPSAQPERTGRWCFNTDGQLVCSNCYDIPTNRILLNADMIFDMTPIQKKMKFCPNCGARMLKGKAE